MSGKQNTSEASVTRFELKANNAVWELIIGKIFRGERGEKGEDGEAGYTPVKGVDYWTPEDAAAIEAAKKAATDAAARADAAAQQATDKVDKAVAGIQIDLDSKQDKLSAENPVQTEQIADNAISASKLSAEVATAVGKIPQLEESVSVNNTSIENLGADVQELRENLQEKQDALSAENPVQTEEIADSSITLKKLGADVTTRFVEYLPTINYFDEVVGSDVGWKKEDMQRAAQIYASGRVGVSIYDAGGNLPMILINASDDLEDIGSCFAVLEYHSVLTSGHVESIYMHLDYKEATNKTTVTQFTHLTRLVPRNFVTDDTLNYVQDEPDTDNDTLGVAKGSISKEYLSPKLQEVVRPLSLPQIETFGEPGTINEEWTTSDYTNCKYSLGDEITAPVYLQVLIENKLFNPIRLREAYDETPERIVFGRVGTTGSTVVCETVTMYSQDGKVYWGQHATHPLRDAAVFETIDVNGEQLLDGFSGTFIDFETVFGVDSSVFVYAGGPLTISAPWFDTTEISSMTAIYCNADEPDGGMETTTVFSNGERMVTVSRVVDGDGEITITSKSLLTEGSAPTVAQYNALNDKIGNIDTVLTSIMGE